MLSSMLFARLLNCGAILLVAVIVLINLLPFLLYKEAIESGTFSLYVSITTSPSSYYTTTFLSILVDP